ncbi:MAG: AfsA-related hotdog domain-containing protein [Gaiellaceae bacterium]
MTVTTEAALSFERTVDPREVWSLAPETTFVTDWHYDREREVFDIAARLPLAHLRYSDTPNPYPDIVLLSQIAAQAGVIVVAERLDVSLDSTFLLRRLAIELDPLEANLVSRDATRFTLTTDREGTWFKQRRTGTPPTGSMIARCTLEGRPCGTLEVQGIWVDDRLYQTYRRMGGGAEPETLPADAGEPEPHTGRSLPRNRAISRLRNGEGPGRYAGTVLVDENDPTFYERPLDHVPGLLLLDAAKQGTTAAVCRERSVPASRVVVDSAEFLFSRFAELHAPVHCQVDLTEGLRAIRAECTQGGRTVCKANLKATVLDGDD